MVVVATIVAFVLAVASSLFVLLPREFVFALKGSHVYEELFAVRDDPAEVHRRLAYDMQRFWMRNNERMTPVERAVHVAAWSVAVEMLALTVLAAGILR